MGRLTRYLFAGICCAAIITVGVSWIAERHGAAANLAEARRSLEPRNDVAAAEMVELATRVNESMARRYDPIPRPSGIFTVPDSLRHVVDFWKRIYTEIYSFQVVVHDNERTDLIWGIVDLRDEAGRDDVSYDTLRKAALDVGRRYQKNVKTLLTTRYDAAKLEGELKRLHDIIERNGGVKKMRGSESRVRVQRGLRDVFQDSIIRSGRYLEEYRRIFREQGLPEELALLPHLESSFRFDANSSAGAVGIWQLTRGAVHKVIHVSTVVDERIDPWRSAEAAARIMRDNYATLKSWPLAVTAYNQGTNAMRAAVRVLKTRDIATVVSRYRGRSFGFAGRNFYCAFVAVIEVASDYQRYYGDLAIEAPHPVNQHTVAKAAPLKTIAKELGVEANTLAELNPHLRKPAVSANARLPMGTVLNLPMAETENR